MEVFCNFLCNSLPLCPQQVGRVHRGPGPPGPGGGLHGPPQARVLRPVGAQRTVHGRLLQPSLEGCRCGHARVNQLYFSLGAPKFIIPNAISDTF